jgi:hypothetical protein
VNGVLGNWIGGVTAIVATVLLQYTVQRGLVRVIAAARRRRLLSGQQGAAAYRLALLTVFVLIFGHLGQVGAWALVYLALGELPGLAAAFYFSLASYTTVGAAELQLSDAHRVLGALEAGVGALMFGWSTALMVALVGLEQASVPGGAAPVHTGRGAADRAREHPPRPGQDGAAAGRGA